jgi:hypothetical protein
MRISLRGTFLLVGLLETTLGAVLEATFNSTSPKPVFDDAPGLHAGAASAAVCSYSATCSAGGYEGVCVSISSGCCSGGIVTSNLCPGSEDIKCCTTPACATPSGTGSCMQTSTCASQGGTAIAGYCSGPSDMQCCVKSPAPVTELRWAAAPGPTPPSPRRSPRSKEGTANPDALAVQRKGATGEISCGYDRAHERKGP